MSTDSNSQPIWESETEPWWSAREHAEDLRDVERVNMLHRRVEKSLAIFEEDIKTEDAEAVKAAIIVHCDDIIEHHPYFVELLIGLASEDEE